MVMGAFAGGLAGSVVGQAVIEVVVDNSGVNKSLTNTQKMVAGLAVAGFSAATVAAISFEASLTNVAKTTNLTGSDLKALGQEFRDMASDIPMSASALANIGATAAQLGVQSEDLTIFTEAVAKLGTATNIVGEQGAMDLARFINVMGESTSNVERIGSSIVDLGNNVAATEGEILALALRTAAAGRQMNLSTGDVLGLAAAAASLGLEAEAGGTALSRVMLDIYARAQKGSQELRLHAQVAGMTADAYHRMVRESPMEALTAFIGGLGSAEQRGINVIQMLDDMSLGNVRVRDALLRLAGAQDLMTAAVGRGNQAYQEGTALEEEFQLFRESTINQLKILANRFTELGLVVGDMLIPPLGLLLDVTGGILDVFTALPQPMQSTILMTTGLVAVLPALIALINAARAAMVSTIATVKAATLAVRGFTLALAANPITLALLAGSLAIGAVAFGGFGKEASRASESVARLNAAMKALGTRGTEADRIREAQGILRELVSDYDRAKVAQDQVTKSHRDWVKHRTSMRESRAEVKALFQSLDQAGVPINTLRYLISQLDGELQKSAVEGVENYEIRLKALEKQLEVDAFRRAASNFSDSAASLDDVTSAAERARQELRALGMEAAALQTLTDFGVMALFPGEARDAAVARLRDAFYGDAATQKAVDDLIAEVLEGLPKSTSGSGRKSAGGSREQTALERLSEEFDAFASRAPRSMAEVRAELERYRDAAEKAGDATALGLIDALLKLDPTVSDIRGAISSLQAQYGDLAADAEESARRQQQAADDVARAWETTASDAVRQADTLGNALVSALRKQAQEASDLRIQSMRDAADALLAPLQAQLDALDAGEAEDELARLNRDHAKVLADLDKQLKTAWDPREQEDIRERREKAIEQHADRLADIERRKTRAGLQARMQDIRDDLAQREKDERESLARSTEEWRLQLQARNLIASGNFEEMARLLAGQEDQWSLAGKSLGDAIVNGLNPPVEAWMAGLASRLAALGVGGGGGGGVGTTPASKAADKMLGEIARAKAGGAPGFALEAMRAAFEREFGYAPGLARGGVITSPTFALLGETSRARPEIVTPEHLMADTFRRVLRDEGAGGGDTYIRVYLGDREIRDVVRVEVEDATALGAQRSGMEGGYGR